MQDALDLNLLKQSFAKIQIRRANSNRYFDSKEVTSKIKHIVDKIFRIFVLVCVSGKPRSLKLKVSSFPGKIFEFSF